jgi:hypothetical protein
VANGHAGTASPHLPSIRHNLEFSSRLKQVGRNITGHGFSNPWTTTDRNVHAPGFEAPFTAFRRMATRGEDAASTLLCVLDCLEHRKPGRGVGRASLVRSCGQADACPAHAKGKLRRTSRRLSRASRQGTAVQGLVDGVDVKPPIPSTASTKSTPPPIHQTKDSPLGVLGELGVRFFTQRTQSAQSSFQLRKRSRSWWAAGWTLCHPP